ncbi:MAG: hypothetical protein HY695_39140 [Deltaproteobacteria bacterium]|nr:hypothetical protein [Deltaproteobacteria bacterium]
MAEKDEKEKISRVLFEACRLRLKIQKADAFKGNGLGAHLLPLMLVVVPSSENSLLIKLKSDRLVKPELGLVICRARHRRSPLFQELLLVRFSKHSIDLMIELDALAGAPKKRDYQNPNRDKPPQATRNISHGYFLRLEKLAISVLHRSE